MEWTNFNKNLNKDKNNIEYVHLDIYKDSWDIIPDVDVVFIDAGHGYQQCKSDMYNSIRNFKNLKYIIFDDYGVWSGVKQCVNESLINNTLIFENYIGLNNVPGPGNKVFKNTAEGIICRINQLLNYHSILNKTYIWENSNIEFLENGNMNAFGAGKYRFIDKYLVKCDFGNREHFIKFNSDYSIFTSVRKDDLEVISGDEYTKKLIPKIVMQTAFNNSKILVYNGLPFHFEMFGCVLDYAKNYNLDVDIVNTTEDNHQWFSLYQKYFTFNLYKSLSDIDINHYNSVILLTDDDYSFPKNLVSEKTICINHFYLSRRNDIKCQLTISKFKEDIDKFCFPIWNCITQEEKVNILKHNDKPIITLIGNSNIHNTNNIKKIIKNYQDFEFKLINRDIPNNIPKFIKTYENLNSIELFNILKQTSYVLYLQSNTINSIYQQNNMIISGSFPLAISNACHLIIPNGIMKPLNLKSIIYYDEDNPILLNKITNLEEAFYDRDRLTDIRNHSLLPDNPYTNCRS